MFDEANNNRRATRYPTKSVYMHLAVDNEIEKTEVADISTSGASVVRSGKLSLAKGQNLNVNVIKTNSGFGINNIPSVVITEEKSKNGSDKYIYRLAFKSQLCWDSLCRLTKEEVAHLPPPTDSPINSRQHGVALTDMNWLQNAVQNMKTCQFQLILMSLPLLFGVLSTIAAYLTYDVKDISEFVFLLPPVCGILSFVILGVFLQKTSSIRRCLSFMMLMQKYLTIGRFPPCYRGWQDAYENYNRLIRYNTNIAKPYKVSVDSSIQPRNKFPVDKFTWYSVALLLVIPVFSIASIVLIAVKVGISPEAIGWASFLAGILLAVGLGYSSYNCYQLIGGRKTFDHVFLTFDAIIQHAPPYDASTKGPLGVMEK